MNQCREINIDQHELTQLKMENRCSRRIIISSFIYDTCRKVLFTTTVTKTYLTFPLEYDCNPTITKVCIIKILIGHLTGLKLSLVGAICNTRVIQYNDS